MKITYNNLELERKAVGIYIVNNNLLYESRLQPKHFYNSELKLIFETMLKLKVKEEINIITLDAALPSIGMERLINLTTYSLDAGFIESIENELISLYRKRELVKESMRAIQRLENNEEVEEIKNDLSKSLEENESNELEGISLSNCLLKGLVKTEEAYQNGGKITGMTTGFKRLDNILNGFEKPSYYVIGARPGVGKTAFALELMKRLSIKNKLIYFSIEMPFYQLGQRVLASCSNIQLKKIKTGSINSSQFDLLNNICKHLQSVECNIVEKENLKIEDLISYCTNYKRKNGLDVIIIDYFTLLKSYKNFKTIRELYNFISEELRVLSKKLNISVILLAQCNRKADEKKELQLSDLKETANLEQDANVVMFLEAQDDEMLREVGEPVEDYLILKIKKNRAGENNMQIKFRYYKSTQQLDEVYGSKIIKTGSIE